MIEIIVKSYDLCRSWFPGWTW